MSEHITHIAVYEDCMRIMQHGPKKLTKAFHEAVDKAYDAGLFCSGARGNHLFAIPIIEDNRELYGTPRYGKKEAEQVAGAVGWLTHRAADLQMKPIFKQVDELGNQMLWSDECQMYHDAMVYKEVYKGGKLSTLSDLHPVNETLLSHRMQANTASKHLNVDCFENLMAHYYVGQMMSNNLFTSELGDVNEFTEKMVESSSDLYEDLRIYIRAYENPEPFKYHGYLSNFNIYNREDALIRFVRYVQEHNAPHPSVSLPKALADASQQSNYAQALKRGYDYIEALSDFFEKKISREKVIELCEI